MGEGSPGRSEGSGEEKERAKDSEKRARGEMLGGKKWRRNERECCFDVKGDGRAVVSRARGRERKIKEKGVKGKAGGEDKRQSRPQTVSSK